MSNIVLNIVEPSSPTPINPVDPGTGTAVPDTGLFTHGIGGAEAAIIATITLVVLLAIIGTFVYHKKKVGKRGDTLSLLAKCKKAVKNKKYASGLAVLALLVSIGTVAGLLKLGVNAIDSEEADNTEVQDSNALTVTAESEELTIELADEPVFAVLPVDITVTEATQAGYTLTAYADSTDLVSTTDSSNIIPMVVADEAELVALTDNTYGLSLLEPDSEVDEVYTALSTDSLNPTILKTIDDFSPTTAEDRTTIYYGFYITPDTPYGTYTGSNINYLAEPNYITTLAFNGNGSDGGEAIDTRIIAAGDTITLPANTFTREGYHFTGWNTVATPTEQEPGESYADEAEYTADSGQSKNVTLYAQWEEDVLYMQDVATWGSTLSQGDTMEAVDSRDGKSYWVAKLADDNIWMTQNLDLDIEADRTYTSADTDLANSTIGTSWTPTVSTSTTSSWTSSTTAPESYDPGDLYWDGTLNTNWDGNLDNETVTDPPTSGGTHYHIGNYYNWTAAVAMSDSSSYTSGGTDVNQSICPAGWRLPTYSGDKSYDSLVTAQSLTAGTGGNIQNTPVYFVYGGGWSGGSGSVGSGGDYWSSVVDDSGLAYQLYFLVHGDLGPQGDGGRNNGYSVRCVAR